MVDRRPPVEQTVTGTSAGSDGWPSPAAELQSIPLPWGIVLATGSCGVVLGAAVLNWPDASLWIMSALTGMWLLVAGVAQIIGAFLGSGSIARRAVSGIAGVVALIAGLVCLRDLAGRLAVLALLFAVTCVVSGITEVVLAVRSTGRARLGLVGAGLVSVAAGIVFLLAPDLSLEALVILTGTGGLLVGLAEVVLAFVLRRQAARIRAARSDGH